MDRRCIRCNPVSQITFVFSENLGNGWEFRLDQIGTCWGGRRATGAEHTLVSEGDADNFTIGAHNRRASPRVSFCVVVNIVFGVDYGALVPDRGGVVHRDRGRGRGGVVHRDRGRGRGGVVHRDRGRDWSGGVHRDRGRGRSLQMPGPTWGGGRAAFSTLLLTLVGASRKTYSCSSAVTAASGAAAAWDSSAAVVCSSAA
jgi:hypothetical protein